MKNSKRNKANAQAAKKRELDGKPTRSKYAEKGAAFAYDFKVREERARVERMGRRMS